MSLPFRKELSIGCLLLLYWLGAAFGQKTGYKRVCNTVGLWHQFWTKGIATTVLSSSYPLEIYILCQRLVFVCPYFFLFVCGWNLRFTCFMMQRYRLISKSHGKKHGKTSKTRLKTKRVVKKVVVISKRKAKSDLNWIKRISFVFIQPIIQNGVLYVFFSCIVSYCAR